MIIIIYGISSQFYRKIRLEYDGKYTVGKVVNIIEGPQSKTYVEYEFMIGNEKCLSSRSMKSNLEVGSKYLVVYVKSPMISVLDNNIMLSDSYSLGQIITRKDLNQEPNISFWD